MPEAKYYPSHTSQVSKFNQFFFDAYRTLSSYYAQAYRDLRAYSGDNWTQQEKASLLRQKRMIIELNKIRRIINLYSGYERENRTSTIVSPIESADQETADQLSEIMLYVYSKAQSEYVFSEAFEHSLKTGLAIIGMYIDYSNDKVNGDLKFYWKPFNALILDPYFTKRDLSDCDQAATRDLLGREHIKALLPNVDPEVIDNIPAGIRDNKYQYLGLYQSYQSTYLSKNMLTYDQYWERVSERRDFLVDKETGESQLWDGSGQETHELKQMMKENRQFELVRGYHKTVNLNIIVGDTQLYEGPDPVGIDDYPFAPALCYHEPLIDSFDLKIQGVVRQVRDAQRIYNRRHSQIIDIMESVINTGWIHKNGSVLDPDMLFQSGQGRNIVVNEDSDPNADIRQINPPQIPQGYLAYQDVMDQNIMEIPGGSEEILGLSSTGDGQVSGKLAEVRASNGLKGNRGLFDNWEYTQKIFGNKVLKAIQVNFTPGKVARIINREPTEQFFSQDFDQYDAVITSTVKTQTQREAYYYQLLQLRSLGVAIPDDELIDAVPMQGKMRLVKKMEEIAQQQQQAAQVEMMDKNRQNRLQEAEIESKLGLAEERRARVIADIGLSRERISESEQNYAKALLDNVRTVHEMQDVDAQRMIDTIRLVNELTEPMLDEQEETLQRDKVFGEGLRQISEPENESLPQEGADLPQGGMNG